MFIRKFALSVSFRIASQNPTMPAHAATAAQRNNSKYHRELHECKSLSSGFQDALDDNGVLERWPKYLQVRMELRHNQRAKELAELALMCPGVPSTLAEIEQICQDTDFKLLPPKRQNARTAQDAPADSQPRILKPSEVHIINQEYLKHYTAFLQERASQDASAASGEAQISIMTQASDNQMQSLAATEAAKQEILAKTEVGQKKLDQALAMNEGFAASVAGLERKVDHAIGMLQARRKERSGTQWAFVCENAPGAPLKLDTRFFYDPNSDEVYHNQNDHLPEGGVACFQVRLKFLEGLAYMINDEGGSSDDVAPLQPVDAKYVLKTCNRFKFKPGIALNATLAKLRYLEGVFMEYRLQNNDLKARATFNITTQNGRAAQSCAIVPLNVVEFLPFADEDVLPGPSPATPVLEDATSGDAVASTPSSSIGPRRAEPVGSSIVPKTTPTVAKGRGVSKKDTKQKGEKKPPNKFQLFCAEYRQKVREDLGGKEANTMDVENRLKQMWKALRPDEQEPYAQRASHLRATARSPTSEAEALPDKRDGETNQLETEDAADCAESAGQISTTDGGSSPASVDAEVAPAERKRRQPKAFESNMKRPKSLPEPQDAAPTPPHQREPQVDLDEDRGQTSASGATPLRDCSVGQKVSVTTLDGKEENGRVEKVEGHRYHIWLDRGALRQAEIGADGALKQVE